MKLLKLAECDNCFSHALLYESDFGQKWCEHCIQEEYGRLGFRINVKTGEVTKKDAKNE